jgi:serine/threonine protein kinase
VSNQVTDNTMYRFVLEVKQLEPLHLRKQWMHDLAQAVAFLESLNLAHGDLQPGNIFMHGARIKLSDFDCTAEFGQSCGTPGAPYGRLLNGNESHLGERGCPDPLSSRTEQFALGSVFYFINYGFEVHGDRSLTEDPYYHGPKVIDVLQQMEFPKLGGDNEVIDDIIDKCWHYKYTKVADLVKDLEEKLLPEVHNRRPRPDHHPTEPNEDDTTAGPGNLIDGIASMEVNGHDRESARLPTDLDREDRKEDYDTKRAFCQDLVSRGLVDKLSSKQPEELGFTMEWYRYSS